MTFKEEVFHDWLDMLDKRIEKHERLSAESENQTITRQKLLIELLQMKAYVHRRFADYNTGLARGVEIGNKHEETSSF